MASQITETNVQRSIVVNASQERAFDVFVNHMGTWWPEEHHLSGSESSKTVLEVHVGGRWYDRADDGSECEIGRVLVLEPPSRIVMDWQLTADWQYDSSFHTEVEIRFIPEAENRTRVELEHRSLEAYGDNLAQVRESLGSEGGWTTTLKRFAAAV